ncbi:hypothetical protein PsYK624_137030 [Phanerochaete sordida]|uniref:SUN domain-containing protein n=1 Tax=Phanerochaete sordida TaxID=48140 RepID=A0A9P3LKQ2_9APHY|nr:hypothetical protein PsYK624_137030 [Phanerochaete sordida]
MAPLNTPRGAATPQRPRQTRHSSLQFEPTESSPLPRTPRRSTRHLRPTSSSQRTLVAADSDDEHEPDTTRHMRRATTPLASVAETTRRLAPATFPRRPSTAEPTRPRSLSRHRKHLSEDNRAYMPPRQAADRAGVETDEGFEDGARGRRGWLRRRAAAGGPIGEAGVAGSRRGSAMAESVVADDGAVTEEDEPSARASGKRRATASKTPSRYSSPLAALDADRTLVDIEDEDSELEAELDHLRDVLEADEFAEPDEAMDILTQPSFALGAMLGRAFQQIFALLSSITSSFVKASALAVVVLGVYIVLSLSTPHRPSSTPHPSLPVDHSRPPVPIPVPETPDAASRILSMESAIASLSARLSADHGRLEAHLQSLDASVDELSKLPKDTLAIPDFALWSGGATVAPELTSPTFAKPATRALGFLWTTNPGADGAPPETALRPETHRGACWPLAGAHGQLGVALPAPVHVAAVSVDHVAREVAPDGDVRSAPRAMEVWARVEGAENLARLARDGAPRAVQKGEGLEMASAEDAPEARPGAETYVRLAEFMYDIHAPRSVQTFEIPQEMRDLGLETQRVALRIKSNWGQDEFTCLYRFRVHGEQRGPSPV